MVDVSPARTLRLGAAFLAAGLAAGYAQLQPARVLILIGPPGSGKTAQAEYLRKRHKIPAVSMAQLLHEEINRKSPLGKALAASLESGELVSDSAANELMKARLLRPDAARGFILDGYPATAAQAHELAEFLSGHRYPQPVVIVMDVPEDVSRNRMTRRRRADDTPGNIDRRLRDYREVGRLVEEWYGPERVVRVDATGAPAVVASRIAAAVEAVQSRDGLRTRPSGEKSLQRRQAPGDSSPRPE